LVYRITKNEIMSAGYSKMDRVISYLPGINKFCSNVIYLFERK
jgi:hypothetical protein